MRTTSATDWRRTVDTETTCEECGYVSTAHEAICPRCGGQTRTTMVIRPPTATAIGEALAPTIVVAPARRSSLQQFSIADFLQWHRQGELILNPAFQRRPVWTNDARSYLIDTILRGFSMPKIYLRTTINPKTRTSIRDVVDGQQRLRTIIDFDDDALVLNKRANEFAGMRYSDLGVEYQEAFLSYQITVEHLINATDQAVLETFARLNSYTVPLNPAELRHAMYDSELKWSIYWLTNDLRWFLQRYNIVSMRTMVRMDDDAFFAELVNLLVNGIVNGGAAALDALYKKNQGAFPRGESFREIISDAVTWMDANLGQILANTPLGRSYQVQMLFAAYAHLQHRAIPSGRLPQLPDQQGLDHPDAIVLRLAELAEAIESEEVGGPHRAFVDASSGATTRFKSRSVRFLAFVDAMAAR